MVFQEFLEMIQSRTFPESLPGALKALWWDACGDWHRAHEAAQETSGIDGAWVHAYLHRKEGDGRNAAYWYRQAGRPVFTGPLEAEWEQIAKELLASARRP